MSKEKIAITLDEEFISELDRLVERQVFRSRSQAIREAVSEKLLRMKRSRLAIESAKLDKAAEKALADEGMTGDFDQWPAC